MSASSWSAWAPRCQSLLRIMAGFMFTLHGTTKLFGFPAASPGGPVHLMSQIGLAATLEAFGGALLMLGLFTRPVAFIVSGEMAVAFFQVHFPRSFWPSINGGEIAALYCFVWLFFSAAGGGAWSLDALVRKRS